MQFMIFPFLTEELQGMRAGLAGPFLKAAVGLCWWLLQWQPHIPALHSARDCWPVLTTENIFSVPCNASFFVSHLRNLTGWGMLEDWATFGSRDAFSSFSWKPGVSRAPCCLRHLTKPHPGADALCLTLSLPWAMLQKTRAASHIQFSHIHNWYTDLYHTAILRRYSYS